MSRKNHKPRNSGNYILEQATWQARWLAILVFALTYPFAQYGSRSVYLLLAAGILYNLLRYVTKIHTRPFLRSPLVMLFIDFGFLAWLMCITGGVSSPYVLYIAMPILTAVYIRRSTGTLPILLMLAASGLILFGTSLFSVNYTIDYGSFRTACTFFFTFIITAYMADRLTESERFERNYALSVQYQAEAERSRLITLINSVAEVVLAVDAHGIITLYNAAALNMLAVHDLNGKNIAEILPLIDDADNAVNIMEVAKANTMIVQRNDLRFKNTNDESLINLDISIAPVKAPFKDHSGDNSAYIMIIRDITKSKDLEQQRDEFLSVITHELRTPVATAEAGVSILLTPKISSLNPELTRYAQIAHDSIVFLAELINDLASLSKLERGIYKIVPEPLDVKELLKTVIRENDAAAKAKGLRLEIDPIGSLPVVLTSKHEVREILQNLVTNAIKYTQTGSITLGVKALDEPEQGIVFSVTDTGIGIAATDKPHLFEKFYRSEDFRTRTAGGTGLGLYITQMLAQRLNAKIWFESKLNHGSTFYLSIPPFSKLEQDQRQVIDAQLNTIISNI